MENMMFNADVAQTQLVPFDAIDFDKYSDGGFISIPPEGKYIGQAPSISDESFGFTAAGYLKLTVDPITVVAPGQAANGYKIRFTNLSSKKYSNREGSQVMDFLRACGIAARPTSPEELKAACKMASGRTFQFALVWEAYNKDTKESTSGVDNFPLDGQGNRQTYLVDQYDASKKWYANGKVKYFISAIAKS